VSIDLVYKQEKRLSLPGKDTMFIDSQKYPYLLGQRTYIKIESYLRLLGQISKDTF
jgi:hypothetical protein